MNNLKWLQKFYISNCDGEWERGYGITINTVGNPGWSIGINLQYTCLENKKFNRIDIQRNEHNWIGCKLENNIFKGGCGPNNLDEMIGIFRKWVAEQNYDIDFVDPFLKDYLS